MGRLKQWGIPEREIADLETTGQIKREMEIDSPASGFIVERNALPNMYVQPGTKLYSIADLSSLWVYAQVFQNDIGRVKVGDSAAVTVDSYPGTHFPGTGRFISPQLDQTTRTAGTARDLNPGMKLSLGMFVNVKLDLSRGRQLVIPASGVYQSGTRQIAFVDKTDGHFEPREIEAGARAGDDFVVVTKGLKAGEHIATSANFLLDSVKPGSGGHGVVCSSTARRWRSVRDRRLPTGQGIGRLLLYAVTTSQGGEYISRQTDRRRWRAHSGRFGDRTFFMAAMPAMGMAAMRNVVTLSDKGAGAYEEPGQLQSGGSWQVTIVATKSGQTIAQKQLSVTAEGSM